MIPLLPVERAGMPFGYALRIPLEIAIGAFIMGQPCRAQNRWPKRERCSAARAASRSRRAPVSAVSAGSRRRTRSRPQRLPGPRRRPALRSRTPASPDLPAASPAGRVHPRGDDRGLFDGADRVRGWLLHQLQLARNQFPPRLDRALAVPHPPRIDVEPHPGARRRITVVIGRRIIVLIGRRNSLSRGTPPDRGHRPGRSGQRRVVPTHKHQAARRPPIRRGRTRYGAC
jgi:hypothetical protein